LFTLLMFSTPWVLSRSSKALAPLVAQTLMPSFQVAQPQRIRFKLAPELARCQECIDGPSCVGLVSQWLMGSSP